jgi:hypothetical protein
MIRLTRTPVLWRGWSIRFVIRYFFHLQAPAVLYLDYIGVPLPDLPHGAVMTEAIWAVRQASRGEAADWSGWAIKVVSEDGNEVLVLPFDRV